jgi:hypothetical protein
MDPHIRDDARAEWKADEQSLAYIHALDRGWALGWIVVEPDAVAGPPFGRRNVGFLRLLWMAHDL